MNTVKSIDMTLPTALYLSLVGVLVFLVFADSRISPAIAPLIGYIPYKRYTATGFSVLSVLIGLLGSSRHAARIAEPWRVPQSQVFLCFIMFFFFGLTAIALST